MNIILQHGFTNLILISITLYVHYMENRNVDFPKSANLIPDKLPIIHSEIKSGMAKSLFNKFIKSQSIYKSWCTTLNYIRLLK